MQDENDSSGNGFEGVDQVKIFLLDLNGAIRSLIVNPKHMASIMEKGVGFDGSSVAGISTVEDSDRLLIPVPDSKRVIHFKTESTGFFIGGVYDSKGRRSPSDSRAVLEKMLMKARDEYGLTFTAGPEHEFFLLSGEEFDEGSHSDKAGYFHTDPCDKGELVRNNIIRILERCGVTYEKTHHEVTASQHEINLECGAPLEVADRTVLFNYVAKKVAAENDYHVTFMPKPFDGQNRNALHIHLSAQNLDGDNVFYDPDAEHSLSTTARRFIGGILKYARESSIIMASTANSYKAYVREREAPIVRGWGLSNRSSLVRKPLALTPQATRIELRCPDPAGNVYLQMAVLIAMGLRGVSEKLDCGDPDKGSTYDCNASTRIWDERFLPKCMFEALVEAEKSEFLRETLGEFIYTQYMNLKVTDWEEHRTSVTMKDYEKYLKA